MHMPPFPNAFSTSLLGKRRRLDTPFSVNVSRIVKGGRPSPGMCVGHSPTTFFLCAAAGGAQKEKKKLSGDTSPNLWQGGRASLDPSYKGEVVKITLMGNPITCPPNGGLC